MHARFLPFIDGYHKLIRWRMVVHAGIDGYSRLVVFLSYSDNNRAETVYSHFLAAVQQHGLPSRVRSDQGGENLQVALHMIRYRGTNRNSMLVGSSVHNQRIERLWRDLHRCTIKVFYNLFYFLEQIGLLDPLNELHLFALHFVYIPRISYCNALQAFQSGWNNHGIRTEHQQTPNQLFVRGCLQLQNSGLTAMDLFEAVNNNYGVDDNDAYITNVTDNENSITVPPSRFTLSEQQIHLLQEASIDPLAESNNYGIEIYEAIITLLS